MPNFAANLTMMFNEVPFLDRFGAAAKAGFTAVEFLFPYEHSPEVIAERLKNNNLTPALFNLPPGDWANGDRGTASIPERHAEFAAGIDTALTYAKATGIKRVHIMAGMADRTDPRAVEAYRKAVVHAASKMNDIGVTVVIEPINGRNMPGYFLNDFAFAESLIHELNLPNLKLQFDIYHRQIIHGDVAMALRKMMPIIGHIQIASVPSRNEPDGEELNFPFLFDELDRLNYKGFVGCEYNPRAATVDGLKWFAPYAGKAPAGSQA